MQFSNIFFNIEFSQFFCSWKILAVYWFVLHPLLTPSSGFFPINNPLRLFSWTIPQFWKMSIVCSDAFDEYFIQLPRGKIFFQKYSSICLFAKLMFLQWSFYVFRASTGEKSDHKFLITEVLSFRIFSFLGKHFPFEVSFKSPLQWKFLSKILEFYFWSENFIKFLLWTAFPKKKKTKNK